MFLEVVVEKIYWVQIFILKDLRGQAQHVK